MTRGYIYILINTSYPGLLKIGKSKRSPEFRANELSMATGVPNSFHVAYYLIVSDIDTAELEIHKYLKEYREVRNREFFRLPLNQAIDLVRKILKKSNIDFANHEEETYKFKYEEYTSTKDFFNDILNDEDKWEHAKLHLEKGYLIPWIKKKGEIDALINLETHTKSEYNNNSDYILSLIAYSITDSLFEIDGIKINHCEDILKIYSHQNINLNEIWINNILQIRYSGYLDARSMKKNDVLSFLFFINYIKNQIKEPKLDLIEKIVKWKARPFDFLHIKTLNKNSIKYLFEKKEIKERVNKLPLNKEIKKNLQNSLKNISFYHIENT